MTWAHTYDSNIVSAAGRSVVILVLFHDNASTDLNRDQPCHFEPWIPSMVSLCSNPDIIEPSSCLIDLPPVQLFFLKSTTTSRIFKMAYCHRSDPILYMLSAFNAWQEQDLSATRCQGNRATSMIQSSASRKQYSSHFLGTPSI